MERSRGFAVIELLMAMAIVALMAEIVVPSFVRAKISANEASAVASIAAINAAEQSYKASYPSKGYAPLASLGGGMPCTPSSANACLIDNQLAQGKKNGYNFAVVGGNPVGGVDTTYAAGSAPTGYSQSGVRRFCSTQDNTIRWDANDVKTTTPPDEQQCRKFYPLL
jgi:type IV pilus assembly protein PilA